MISVTTKQSLRPAATLALALLTALFGLAIPAAGKERAPVAVAGEIGVRSATITADFGAAASSVEIRLRGVDGLVVTSDPNPVRNGTFASGDRTTFSVEYTATTSESNLVVTVLGSFGKAPGVSRSTVTSFTVRNGGGVAREKASGGAIRFDREGKPLHVLPSTRR